MATARAVRLGLGLKRIRLDLGWSLEQVAEEVGLAKSTIHRYETGDNPPAPGITRSVLVAYGIIDKAELDPWIRLSRDVGRAGDDDWWTIYRDVLPDQYVHYIELEAEADGISTYEPLVIPGLLQTPEYVRAVMRAGLRRLSAGEIEQRVAARLKRQTRLERTDRPRLHFIIDETALRRPIDASIMREQLEHLRKVAELPLTTLQVLPLSSNPHLVLGQVVTLRYDDLDQTFASTETPIGVTVFHKSENVAAFQEVFDLLTAKALGKEESLDMLGGLAAAHE